MKNKNIMFSPGLGIRSFRFHAIRTFFRSFALFQKSGGALRSFLFFWKERKDGLLFSLCLKRAEKRAERSFWRLFEEKPRFLLKTPVFWWKLGFFVQNFCTQCTQKRADHSFALFKKSGKSGSLFSKRVERADRSFWNEGRAKERKSECPTLV